MLDEQPGVLPVGVGETWRRLFAKIVLKVTGIEVTMLCQDDHLCDGLKAGIDGAVHGVQAIWYEILWHTLVLSVRSYTDCINLCA